MALNIKDERTHKLVKELAGIRGVSQAEVVRDLAEDAMRLRRREQLTEKWLQIIKDTGPRFGEHLSSETMDDYLYDEDGLPK